MEAQEPKEQIRDGLIMTLLAAAISRPESERALYLDQACASDAGLLEEMKRRVKWEERLGGFLLKPIIPFERLDRPFAPGDTILRGRFRIVRLAGEGGMGIVYEAFDEKLGQRVAIKCPRYEFRRRLSPEVLKGLRVTHPNVCRVFEIHTEEMPSGDVDFLTMEFLDGETLAARLSRGELERGAPRQWLDTGEGKEIARQICAGLSAIHAQGIVHRDLKAANVMLSTDSSGDPRAVIMDFGIAQGSDLYSSAARGTMDYLAPELWRGAAATAQSDIYALGVLLYEMACGHKPFPPGASWQERMRARPEAPAGVGKNTRAAVVRCLEPDPSRRSANVADVEKALFGRRWFLAAAVGAAACGAVGAAVSRYSWGPVRIAILPPEFGENVPADIAVLVKGFVNDLAYRFKSPRGSRRPLFSIGAEGSDGVWTMEGARKVFGATHAIAFDLAGDSGGWALSASLFHESGRTLRQWARRSERPAGALASVLFQVQSRIAQETFAELGLAAVPGRKTVPEAAYADYLQGLYYARIDYEKAPQGIPFFERVIAAAPDSGLGYAGLAEALVNARYTLTRDNTLQGRAQIALAAAEQREPDLPQVYLISGKLNAKYLPERALADFRRATELDPQDPEAFLEMGRLLGKRGRLAEAEAAFRAGIAVQPGYYKCHLMRGTYFYRILRYAEAERDWLEAARLELGQTRARLNLVTLYMVNQRLMDAQYQLEEAIKVNKSRSTFEALGSLLGKRKLYADSVKAYEEAIAMGPRFYKTWEGLASAYRKAGRQSDAIRTYRTGLEDTLGGLPENPADAERVAWCAFYHGAIGEAGPARARAAEAIALETPVSNEVRQRLVFTFDKIHDLAAAFRLLEGVPAEFMKGLLSSGELSDEMMQSPVFAKLVR